jgi:phenylalanyl-tRNA synthetase beta chain
MRPTLRHALIEVVDRNVRAGAPQIAAFEVGRVYLPRRSDGAEASEALPDEREMVVGVVSGSDADSWGQPAGRALDFFDAKGMLDAAASALGVTLEYESDHEYALLPGRVARITAGGEPVGVLGELHPETLAAFDVEQPVALFELDVARLLEHVPERVQARAVSRFPAVEQDLALLLDEDVAASAVQAVIEGSGLVTDARVFDVYRGDQLPEGKKSIAFSIRYQVPNRTLTGEDANREQAKIVKRLEREFGAEQRA